MKGNALVKIHQIKTEVMAKYPKLSMVLHGDEDKCVDTYSKMFKSNGWFEFGIMEFYNLERFEEIEDVLDDLFDKCNTEDSYMSHLQRSASSGDIIEVDYGTHTDTYLVMPIGFKKL